MAKKRITALDGFRFLAISGVILFHYFFQFNPFTIGADSFFFRYGYLGVQFFFIISGFVIYMTLKPCQTIKKFLIKRFIRVWPTLFIFSILNFILCLFSSDKEIIPRPQDLLPTLTITDPIIWHKFFNLDARFVDGVEWTLVIEIYFYVVAAIIYFLNKNAFYQNWLLYNFALLALQLIANLFNMQILSLYLSWTLFPGHLAFFTIGMYFYLLFDNQKLSIPIHLLTLLLFVIQITFIQKRGEILFILTFVLLFLLFIYKSSWLSFLSNKLFVKIGMYSYSIYLFHNNIGRVLVQFFSEIFSSKNLFVTTLPTVVVILITCISVESFIMRFISPFLKKYLLKSV